MVAAACQTIELAALKKEIQIAYHPPSSPGLCYADRGEIADMQKAVSVGARQSIAADDYNIPNFCRTALTLAVLLLMIFFSAYLFIVCIMGLKPSP